MFDFSEFEMADVFKYALENSLIKGIPSFEILSSEAMCQQGIADFVGITSAEMVKKYTNISITSSESSSVILSILKYKSGRSREYLQKKTNLSDASFYRATKELIDVGLIIQSGNLYYLSGQSKSEVGDIWAFELKLSNWKRAIFQALQYKAFANYSVIVFPIEKEKLLLNNLETFRNLNIGVLLFDIKNQKSQWLVHPKKEKPISKSQTIYLLYKIASKH